jgi:hypothetical protein
MLELCDTPFENINDQNGDLQKLLAFLYKVKDLGAAVEEASHVINLGLSKRGRSESSCPGGFSAGKKVVDIAMGGLQYDDPLLCICGIVIGFDRKLNFLCHDKGCTSSPYSSRRES